MPARTPSTAETTSTAANPCELVNDHAALIDGCLIDVQVPANGTLRLTQSDGGTFDNTMPLFADFVVSGLVVSQQVAPNLNQFQFSAGQAQVDAQLVNIAAHLTATLAAGDAANPRVDVVSLTTSGTLTVTAGTAAASPLPPTTPAGELKLMEVYVEANASGSTGGYNILQVNSSGGAASLIVAGTSPGQLAVWNDAVGLWQPEPKVVYVRSLADLPAPVGGAIALEDEYTYHIIGDVDLGANYLFCAGASYNIVGQGIGLSSLTSSGPLGVITCNNIQSLFLRDVSLTTTASPGYPLYIVGANGFTANQCFFSGGQEIYLAGTIGSIRLSTCIFNDMEDGLIPRSSPTFGQTILSGCQISGCGSNFRLVELDGTTTLQDVLRIKASFFNLENAGQSVLDVDSYAVITGHVMIHDNLFVGPGTPVVGLAETDPVAYFRDNIGLTNTP